jgi:hypothetical protein
MGAKPSSHPVQALRQKKALAAVCGAFYLIWLGYLVIVALSASS